MIDGIPHWRPPEWLDPHRRPIRNTSHDIPGADGRTGMPNTGDESKMD